MTRSSRSPGSALVRAMFGATFVLTFAVTALSIALSMASPGSWAAVIKDNGPAKGPAEAGVDAAVEARGAADKPAGASRSGSMLRCWNYGRLVYEGPVAGVARDAPPGTTINLPGARPKQILDLKSGLCIVD